ncbi:hypothetical protein PR048_029552 [Dryococelus australis]|uniref:Uncharacterized protein n=1 Tax=Dryococelus australis TaxID=614101 RepID=A0ABQ9GDN9_9NEOP|nr:hypothetical protein PR048_029552 [Dryococelus australis]
MFTTHTDIATRDDFLRSRYQNSTGRKQVTVAVKIQCVRVITESFETEDVWSVRPAKGEIWAYRLFPVLCDEMIEEGKVEGGMKYERGIGCRGEGYSCGRLRAAACAKSYPSLPPVQRGRCAGCLATIAQTEDAGSRLARARPSSTTPREGSRRECLPSCVVAGCRRGHALPSTDLHPPVSIAVSGVPLTRLALTEDRLDSTVMCILEPNMFVHWLLPHSVASVTSHLAVWHSLLVSLQDWYGLRVVQDVSNKLRSNCKFNFSVHVFDVYLVLKGTREMFLSLYLMYSPSTKANRVRFLVVTPQDFRMWESSRTMTLLGGFPRRSPVPPGPAFQRCSLLTSLSSHWLITSGPITSVCLFIKLFLVTQNSTSQLDALLLFTGVYRRLVSSMLEAMISLLDSMHRGAALAERSPACLPSPPSYEGEPGSIPGRVTPEFPHVGIVLDDVVGRRVLSGDLPPPPSTLSFRRCSILTSITLIGSQDLAV